MPGITDSLRQQVRVRANNRCEYCHLPDSESVHPFHIEHIIARRHGGNSSFDNLTWACFPCNIAKGTDLATLDPHSGQLTALFNPRLQAWDDHFEIIDGEITDKTANGRATAILLRFNSEQQIALRRSLISLGRW